MCDINCKCIESINMIVKRKYGTKKYDIKNAVKAHDELKSSLNCIEKQMKKLQAIKTKGKAKLRTLTSRIRPTNYSKKTTNKPKPKNNISNKPKPKNNISSLGKNMKKLNLGTKCEDISLNNLNVKGLTTSSQMKQYLKEKYLFPIGSIPMGWKLKDEHLLTWKRIICAFPVLTVSFEGKEEAKYLEFLRKRMIRMIFKTPGNFSSKPWKVQLPIVKNALKFEIKSANMLFPNLKSNSPLNANKPKNYLNKNAKDFQRKVNKELKNFKQPWKN